MAIKLTDAEKTVLETEQGVPFNFGTVEKIVEDRLTNTFKTETTFDCLICGDEMYSYVKNGIELFCCHRGDVNDEDCEKCEEFENEYTIIQMAEKLKVENEFLQKKLLETGREAMKAKYTLAKLKYDTERKTFCTKCGLLIDED